MKTLDLIRYITQHPEYTNIVIMDEDDSTPMQAIERLASIDPSHYEDYLWRLEGSLEKKYIVDL